MLARLSTSLVKFRQGTLVFSPLDDTAEVLVMGLRGIFSWRFSFLFQ